MAHGQYRCSGISSENIYFERPLANLSLFVQCFVCNPHRILLKEPKNKLLPPANEVCEGYVFTGVCLSTGGGGVHGMHAPQACMFQRHACPPRHTPWTCMPPGHACPRACPLPGHACPPRHAHLDTHAPLVDTTRCAQWAGGTHPTGMHSCYWIMFETKIWKTQIIWTNFFAYLNKTDSGRSLIHGSRTKSRLFWVVVVLSILAWSKQIKL